MLEPDHAPRCPLTLHSLDDHVRMRLCPGLSTPQAARERVSTDKQRTCRRWFGVRLQHVLVVRVCIGHCAWGDCGRRMSGVSDRDLVPVHQRALDVDQALQRLPEHQRKAETLRRQCPCTIQLDDMGEGWFLRMEIAVGLDNMCQS